MQKRTILSAGIIAAVLAVGSTTGAVAGSLVTSASIKDNSVRSIDLKDGSAVGKADLKPGLARAISKAGTPGADGQVGPAGPAGPAGADGKDGKDGKDGVNGKDGADAGPSAAGAGYTSTWKAGQAGETVQKCKDGEYVTGGGYSTWGGEYDLGGDNAKIQVTVSAPYISGQYVPISDTDSRFYADQWVVRGFNAGDTDQIVRAWVLCAPIPAN